jgi:transcriptional regulator with XRE-family HTH domain
MKNKLRKIRFERCLRQCEIAARANIAISTLSRIENGWLRPNEKQKKALARALKVSKSWLFPPTAPE